MQQTDLRIPVIFRRWNVASGRHPLQFIFKATGTLSDEALTMNTQTALTHTQLKNTERFSESCTISPVEIQLSQIKRVYQLLHMRKVMIYATMHRYLVCVFIVQQ